MAPLTTRA